MIKNQLFIAAALLVGVAIGFFVKPENRAAKVAEADETAYQPHAAVTDKGESASLAALRKRVKELEAQLAANMSATNALTNAIQIAREDRDHGPRRHRNPREWLEDMKKNDPKRYTAMTNRMAQMRAGRLMRQQNKLDFLSSVDTHAFSSSAKKTHDALQDMIVKREELEEQLHDENLTDEQRRAIFDQMRDADRTIRELNSSERRTLFEETARTLGFDSNGATEFAATMQEIIGATSDRHEMTPPPGDAGGDQPPPPPGN